jgi:hypothetical protein
MEHDLDGHLEAGEQEEQRSAGTAQPAEAAGPNGTHGMGRAGQAKKPATAGLARTGEVDRSGFEPEASGLQNRRSSELIYRPSTHVRAPALIGFPSEGRGRVAAS